MLWRHSHMNFSDGLETAICGYRVSFQRPFAPNTLRVLAATNWLGGGAQTDFVPGRGKPKVRHCI